MAEAGDGVMLQGTFPKHTKDLLERTGNDLNVKVHAHITADQVHEHDSSRKNQVFFPIGCSTPISKPNTAALLEKEMPYLPCEYSFFFFKKLQC